MCVPDGIFFQAVQIDTLAVPQGRGIHTGFVALCLDLLTEGDGALGAVLHTQTVGAAGTIGSAGCFGVKEDGVIQLASVQHVGAGKGFLLGFLLGGSLTEEIHAHLQARILHIGEMLLEHGVQHQRAGSTIAAVADADDHKAHACLFDLVPVDVLLILGNIHTEGLAIFQHTVRIEVIEFILPPEVRQPE